jgi:sodium-dependent dicarboxylate transporter 2/3/5
MAAGVEASGLSALIGERLAGLRELRPLAQVVVASLVTVGLSAFASNVATVAVLLPVLGGSVSPGHASTVLFASTVAASCDFALPAGTPPNAIVFGTGYVTVPLMVKTGVALDLCAALLAALWCALAVPLVLG